MSLPLSSEGISPSDQYPINGLFNNRQSSSRSSSPNSIQSLTPLSPPISVLNPLSELKIVPYNQGTSSWTARLKNAAEKIGLFVQRNWKYILLYILAWALILVCHHTVALTLTIWLGIGLGIGVVFGIFTATCVDKENKYRHVNSLWNLINHGILQLDPNGTRQILLATIIASISALIYAVPQAVGLVIGFSIGNQLSINTVYGARLGDEATYAIDRKAHQKRIENIEQAINQHQIVKHQMITQKQLNALIEAHRSNQVDPEAANAFTSLKLNLNQPMPYSFSMPECSVPSTYLDLNRNTPDDIIARADQCIMTLSQTLQQIKQEPDRIIESNH
ncbi:hypothetical protein [Candidatus Chlamydia corallus]|uniref:hypothetical protein n=1 Tax=Candidatus Chlamydia corallus TaxID=2038470 RepID=UPI000C2FB259|nr:hypothetical protein [Candidatus Chlamydia corallus]